MISLPDDDSAIDAAVADIIDGLPHLVPFADAAARLGISEPTLRRWIKQRKLRPFKTAAGACGRVLIPRSEIGRLIRRGLTS